MIKIAFGIIFVFIIISLIVIFCMVLIKIYIKKQKEHTKELFQKDLDFQKSITHTILETQEQVLNAIAQDLHDDAGQQLTYVNFQIENLKLDHPTLENALQPISESVKMLSESIRATSHSMTSHLLSKQKLVTAISNEVKRLQRNKSIDFQLEIEQETAPKMSSNYKIIIYRIFQEMMNNVLKHAKASKVYIIITYQPSFMLTISDNGIGFDYDAIQNKSITLGLQNMQNRALSIGYELLVQSKPNQGTTIVLKQK